MNSDMILKLLNRLVNARELSSSQRNIVTQVIQHVRRQDEEIAELREDITETSIDENPS